MAKRSKRSNRRPNDFDRFSTACDNAGLTAATCGTGHWQIRGGDCLVNFYPNTKHGPVYYVAGTVGGRRGGQSKAIRAARRVPPKVAKQIRARRKLDVKQTVRANLLAKDARCHWCRCDLTRKTATIDHRIPIARGGLDNANNIVLACEPCNQRRGCDMPEMSDGGQR